MVANLTKAPSDGTTFGQSTADKISFYGVTPVIQQSGAAQAAVATSTITTASTTTTPAGYATTTQADAVTAQIVLIRTLVNKIRADLVTYGIIAGA